MLVSSGPVDILLLASHQWYKPDSLEIKGSNRLGLVNQTIQSLPTNYKTTQNEVNILYCRIYVAGYWRMDLIWLIRCLVSVGRAVWPQLVPRLEDHEHDSLQSLKAFVNQNSRYLTNWDLTFRSEEGVSDSCLRWCAIWLTGVWSISGFLIFCENFSVPVLISVWDKRQ